MTGDGRAKRDDAIRTKKNIKRRRFLTMAQNNTVRAFAYYFTLINTSVAI
jgi:hypothetical protein